METDSSGAGVGQPTTSDLTNVMSLLRMPADPAYLLQDHPDARGRAELLAHISAWIVACLRQAETHAGLSVDDTVDLHWRADLAVGPLSHQSSGLHHLLDLQIDRLKWVHQAITKARPRRSDVAIETVSVTVGAIGQLLMTWLENDRRNGGLDPADSMLTDSLVALGEAADRLLRVLRQHRLRSD
jgi:hypothetical protein